MPVGETASEVHGAANVSQSTIWPLGRSHTRTPLLPPRPAAIAIAAPPPAAGP